jgi:hypothetical protein
MRVKIFGKNSPKVASSLSALGTLRMLEGKFSESEALLKQSLETLNPFLTLMNLTLNPVRVDLVNFTSFGGVILNSYDVDFRFVHSRP